MGRTTGTGVSLLLPTLCPLAGPIQRADAVDDSSLVLSHQQKAPLLFHPEHGRCSRRPSPLHRAPRLSPGKGGVGLDSRSNYKLLKRSEWYRLLLCLTEHKRH